MKRIGLVIAVEIQAFNDRYGEPDETIRIRKQEVRKYIKDTYELYVMHSGTGEIAAASTTQFLISKFDVEMILKSNVWNLCIKKISICNNAQKKRQAKQSDLWWFVDY